jgi:hypothetical protein
MWQTDAEANRTFLGTLIEAFSYSKPRLVQMTPVYEACACSLGEDWSITHTACGASLDCVVNPFDPPGLIPLSTPLLLEIEYCTALFNLSRPDRPDGKVRPTSLCMCFEALVALHYHIRSHLLRSNTPFTCPMYNTGHCDTNQYSKPTDT